MLLLDIALSANNGVGAYSLSANVHFGDHEAVWRLPFSVVTFEIPSFTGVILILCACTYAPFRRRKATVVSTLLLKW